MDKNAIINEVSHYLERSDNKWSSSKAIIRKLQINNITPLELDNMLVKHYQKTDKCSFRFSSLPSSINLDILWGSTNRIDTRKVEDIYLTRDTIQVDDLESLEGKDIAKNLFLSHSFKDAERAIQLARKLIDYGLYPWLAEIEILKYDHINDTVKNAIDRLPITGVFVSENLLNSVWAAKEIHFAFKSDKKIIGFVDMTDKAVLSKIKDDDFEGGNKVSKDIFRKFFDNHSDVNFLPYNDPQMDFKDFFDNNVNIIDWDNLRQFSSTYRNPD